MTKRKENSRRIKTKRIISRSRFDFSQKTETEFIDFINIVTLVNYLFALRTCGRYEKRSTKININYLEIHNIINYYKTSG